MKRVLVFALLATLGNTSRALAEESLLKAGTRHVQQMARAESTVMSVPGTGLVAVKPSTAAASAQRGSTTLQSSGLRKRTKVLIAIGMAAGLTGGILAIDGGVENNTPSTLGTRRD